MTRLGRRSFVSLALVGSTMIGGSIYAPAFATDVSHGEMAGAIRSAEYPCAHVLSVDPAGDNAWVVQCNSGAFKVSRNQDGSFTVTQAAGTGER